MYIDAQNLLSDDQDLSQVAGTYYSTNSLDLNVVPRAVGPGEIVKVLFQVTETFVGATSTTTVALIESSDEGPPSADIGVLYTTGLIPVATLVAGFQVVFPIPYATIAERFLSMRFIIATADTTAGTVTAGIVWDAQTSDSDWAAVTGR